MKQCPKEYNLTCKYPLEQKREGIKSKNVGFFLKIIAVLIESRDGKAGTSFILHEPFSAFSVQISVSEHNVKMFYTRKCM